MDSIKNDILNNEVFFFRNELFIFFIFIIIFFLLYNIGLCGRGRGGWFGRMALKHV